MIELYKEFFNYSSRFPKNVRYSLGQKCENLIIEILESTTSASQTKNKAVFLKDASLKLDSLKILIRLLMETKIIDPKKYFHLEKKVSEIGKMLGGWIKSAK